nr:reverse transcriptase domain-containing protein [Tanacetum cinerariifolium]
GDAEKASVKEITVPNEVTDPVLGFPNPASQFHTCGAKDYRTCEGHIGLIKFLFTVKEYQEKDKIGSKPDKNRKRGEARKSLKQLQLKEEEKPKKIKKEWPKTHTPISSDVAELKDMVIALLLDKKNQSLAQATSSTPAPFKAVKSNCVTCGGTHSYQNSPATSGNIYQDNINEYVSQAAAANYNQGNTGFLLKNIQSQGQSTQTLCQNIQKQYQTVQNQLANLTDMMSKFMSSNMASSSRSRTLPGNTVTNPKEYLKGITTRSDVAYKGPTIPTPSKVVKQGTEATKDPVQITSPQSTAHVQPPVTQSKTSVSEPIAAPVSAPMPNLKMSIPCPSRRDDERRREQANEQIEKFYEIFKDMSFEISFTDALILMPKFASNLKALIGNKEKLSEMARTPINEHCSAVILNKLTKKLGDPGKFLIPCEFPGMDECLALADLGASINLMPLSVWKELNEAITYNLDQTSRYSANYDQMTANKIDVTDEACEEYFQEVLGFSNVTASGSPTPSDDPIVSPTSPKLTPFGASDFLLFEKANAFLAILNSDPAPSLPNHEQFVPSFTNELKSCEAKTIKSFVNEPPEVELKDLPPHLEYAFLEGDNKLPVIITKELGEEEKAALIKVLKSHKRAIAWKLSEIQGINPEFYTHKILMEEDYKSAVQHQRRVNPKIHDVIKKEVEKLLDAGLIYPIFDNPWVSPVHCVPKKGGFIVVKNEENELIPTRLVTDLGYGI